jgi:hypothetical protein
MPDIHEIERTRDSVQKHWSKMLFTFGALSLHVAVCGMGWRDRLVVDYLLSEQFSYIIMPGNARDDHAGKTVDGGRRADAMP